MSISVGQVTIDGNEFRRPFHAGGHLVVPFVHGDLASVQEALRIIKATQVEIDELLVLLELETPDIKDI